jgi:hypothetical protein
MVSPITAERFHTLEVDEWDCHLVSLIGHHSSSLLPRGIPFASSTALIRT